MEKRSGELRRKEKPAEESDSSAGKAVRIFAFPKSPAERAGWGRQINLIKMLATKTEAMVTVVKPPMIIWGSMRELR